jgi:outer membrane protein OmpA-like peptidoglycan-associated protein
MKFINLLSPILFLVTFNMYQQLDAAPLEVAPKSVSIRNEIIEVFDRIPSHSNFKFRSWLNNDGNQTLVLGEKIELNYRSSKAVFVYIVYLDTDGIATLLEPSFGPTGNLLAKNINMSFPAPNSGLEITVEPPIGSGSLLSIATETSLPKNLISGLYNSERADRQKYGDRYSLHLVNRLMSSVFEHNSEEKIALSLAHHEIVSRKGTTQYTRKDIVSFFSRQESRSISNPSLDADIRFQTGSHTLTSSARLNLDVWGESLMHPYLAKATFEIGGHTDDVGSSESNFSLSRRRAEMVVEYLSSKFGIAESRLIIHPFGEEIPRIQGSDDHARAVNRRVEFSKITN